MDRSSSPSSWPNDWPIQSDDPLRGWSLFRASSSSKKKSAPGAAAAYVGKRQNKNDAGLDEVDDEEEGSSSGESGDDRDAVPGVDGDDEQDDEEDDLDHLLPGGILREMGTADVHWARGASTSASSASATQTKKYLVILPGLLSLNSSNNTSLPSTARTNDATPQQASAAATTPPPAPNPSTGTILGRFKPPPISLPQTDESGVATLELHDGSGGGILRFEGRPVKTTGKFLWVTNLQKKKKTVTCKHVFDSVLVFGSATSFATTTANGTAGASATDVDAGDSKAAADSGAASDDDDDDTVLVPPLHHYGASRRTVDGGNHLSGAAAAAGSTPKKPKTNATPRASSAVSRVAKHTGTPVSGKRSRKRTKVDDSDTDDSSQDGSVERSSGSDDEEDNGSRGGTSATATTPAPDTSSRRRSVRASAQKPVRYRDQEEEEEESASDREMVGGDGDDINNDRNENGGASDLDYFEDRGTTKAATARRRRVPEAPTVAATLPSPPLGGSRRRQQRDVVDLTFSDEGRGDEPRKTSAAKKRRLSNHEAAVAERADGTEHGVDEPPRAREKTNDTGRSSIEEAKQGQSTSEPAARVPTNRAPKPTKATVGQPHQEPSVATSGSKAWSGSPGHVKAGCGTAGEELPNRSTPGSTHGVTSSLNIEEIPPKRRMSPAKPSDLEVAVMPSSSPSTPNGSSPRPSLPPTVRVRKTPRPKRKPMSILDYVKDEGFD